jgi:hypothetical protein
VSAGPGGPPGPDGGDAGLVPGRWRRWRQSRPFWGGLFVTAGGAVTLASERAPLPLMVHIGIQGVAGYLVPAVLLLCGLLLWFHPAQRTFYSILAVLLALGSWITSNLGGFFAGMLLGVLGGSLGFAWEYHDGPPAARPARPARPAAGRPARPAARRAVRPSIMPPAPPRSSGLSIIGPPLDPEPEPEPRPQPGQARARRRTTNVRLLPAPLACGEARFERRSAGHEDPDLRHAGH